MFQNSFNGGITLLIGISAIMACEKLPPPAAPAQPIATVPEVATTRQQPHAIFEGVPWGSRAELRLGAAITGNPVTMALGARCVSFRSLPMVEFRRNTLIRDACLEIPSNTTIVVQSGVTLGIIATNGLRVGSDVKFNAMGAQGIRGERADLASVTITPDTDAQIYAACVDNGNRCRCPTSNERATAIRGHSGGSGTPGGGVRLVIGALVSPERLVNLDINVTGGRGGPPGESGRQDCSRGAIKCSSDSCSGGTSNGVQGLSGSVYIALAGGKTEKPLRILGGASVPSEAATVIPILSELALQTEVRALSDMAYQNDWDRRSGQDSQ